MEVPFIPSIDGIVADIQKMDDEVDKGEIVFHSNHPHEDFTMAALGTDASYTKLEAHRNRRRNFLSIASVLSALFLATTLTASPAHGLQIAAASEDLLTPQDRASSHKPNEFDISWIRQRLGTKSPYPHEDRPEGRLKDVPKGFELAQLHLINRHGTRYPSADDSVKFRKLTDKLSNTTASGFGWIKSWPTEAFYPAAKGNLLSSRGNADLFAIGSRFATRYKDFLDRYPYDANTYEFRSSAKSRCSQSAYAFTLGFFKDRLATDHEKHSQPKKRNHLKTPPAQPVDIYTIPLGLDQEMAIQYSCPTYINKIADEPSVVQQQTLFQATFLPALAQDLSAKFGIGLTIKDVSIIYKICGFEVTIYDNASTWCQMLLPDVGGNIDKKRDTNFINLEISADLDDFYTHGPGVPFNREMGCKLGASLAQSIDQVLSSASSGQNNAPKDQKDDDPDGGANNIYRGHFKFGHSETIMFFSSFLNLYNQTSLLTGNQTAGQYAARQFRSTLFSPFAANMAFEVYKPKQPSENSQRRRIDRRAAPEAQGLVRLLVNEKPYPIPGCNNALFCEWSVLKNVLAQRGADCDFEACCGSTSPSSDAVVKRADVFASNATCPSTAPLA
ncbi:PHOsphatase [Mortierella claussenii]|nr:PHOsphatase [Mortierella claussenii]